VNPFEPDDDALTFCDQCGWLQPGVRAECERCGVPLDRSVYDPFVAIHQNAAVVRQAIRGRVKPSRFGKLALIGLGILYLGYSVSFLPSLLDGPTSLVAVLMIALDLAIAFLVLSAFHGMRQRDSWDEYRRWS